MAANLSKAVSFQQKRERERQQGHQRQPKPAKAIAARAILPTPERMAKGDFELATIHHDETASRTEAGRFKDWHVTQRARNALTDDQCKIIVKYLDAWTLCEERSPTRDSLDQQRNGGEYNPFKFMESRKNLNRWNACIGHQSAKEFVLVCCTGLGYKGAAIALFGESAGRHDEERIKRHFMKTLGIFDKVMD